MGQQWDLVLVYGSSKCNKNYPDVFMPKLYPWRGQNPTMDHGASIEVQSGFDQE